MQFFHACIKDDLHSFADHYERLRNILPLGIIPIANGGGICLSVSGEDSGTVYIAGGDVSGRQEEPTHPVERSALTPVASSFDEFVNKLEIPERR